MGARPLWSADIPPGVGSHLKCRMGLAMVGVLSSKGSMMIVKPTGGGRDSLRASHDPAHSATPPLLPPLVPLPSRSSVNGTSHQKPKATTQAPESNIHSNLPAPPLGQHLCEYSQRILSWAPKAHPSPSEAHGGPPRPSSQSLQPSPTSFLSKRSGGQSALLQSPAAL